MASYTQRNSGLLVPESTTGHGRNGIEATRPRNRFENLQHFPNTPGGGEPVVEPFEMFVARYNAWSDSYLNPDVAYRMDATLQRAMIQDPVVMEPLQGRMLGVGLLDGAVKAEDEDDEEQKAAAEVIQKIIFSIPSFLKLKMALLWAIWYGRAGVENIYRWKKRDAQKTYAERLTEMKAEIPDRLLEVAAWTPVHGDKLKIGQSSGDLGVFVRINTPAGTSQTTAVGDEARIRWLRGTQRERWIFHRHEILDADFFEPEKAGSISGVGLRERVWWPWWFKQHALQWVMEWANRLGTGFTIWYFEQDNPRSEAAVREAAEQQKGNTQILFPRGPDNNTRGPGIERVEANTGGANFMIQLLEDYFGSQIKLMISGQTLTSETGATGMGSNVAEQHASTRDMIRRYDAINLDETLTRDLVAVIQRWCFPNLRGRLRYESVLEKQDPTSLMDAARTFYDMGGEVPEDHIREVIGIPKPKKGEKVLSLANSQKQQQPEGQPMGGGGMDGMDGGGDDLSDLAGLFQDETAGDGGDGQPEAEAAEAMG